jgi:hypothetical protein
MVALIVARAVEMAVAEVVRVAVVSHGGVAAARTMLVGVLIRVIRSMVRSLG